MAHDNKASYRRIGLTVIFGVVATTAALVYIGGVGGGSDEVYAETYYDKPVNGLSVGSPVSFRGVKLGEVREITFLGAKYATTGKDAQRIYIRMALDRRRFGLEADEDSEFPTFITRLVDAGMRATVVSSGITGLSYVECDISADAPAADKPAWRTLHPYVPAKVSLLESFSAAATKVMNQINTMDFATLWSNVSATVTSLAQFTESVKTTVETQQAYVDKLSRDLSSAAADLRDLAAEVRDNPSLLVRERHPESLDETKK